MAMTAGGQLGLSMATGGYAMSDPAAGAAVATSGYVPVPVPTVWAADITITPVQPLSAAVSVNRAERFVLRIEDPNVALELDTLDIRYHQDPYPAQSSNGWEYVYLGATAAAAVGLSAGFQPGFDNPISGIVTEVFSGTGERATVTVQPVFGLLPGSTGMIRVWIEDSSAAVTTLTWSFDMLDDALSISRREDMHRLALAAERYGWGTLVSAVSTYIFESSEEHTGGRIAVTVNESLLADVGDQLGNSAYGLDILNYTRRYRLAGKLGEYSIDSDEGAGDTADELYDGYVAGSIATPVFADRQVPGDQTSAEYNDADQSERIWRYYTVFILVPPTEQSPDWRWVYGNPDTFSSAFPYGRYGHSDKLYGLVADAWKVIDGDQV